MTSHVPRVGVVVAVYNSMGFIEAALDSIRSQDLTDWVCIVVDDCSPDDTADYVRSVAERDDRVRLLSRTTNGGQCRARNTGLEALDPAIPFVMFLDGDDLYAPGAFRRLVAVLEPRPDAVGAFGLAEYVDTAGAELQPGRHSERQRDRRTWLGRGFRPLAPGLDSTFEDMIAYNPAWPPSVALCRAAVVRSVGGFDPAMVIREDWDLFVRMARSGPFAMLDEQVVWYRRHDANLSRDRVIGDRVHAAAALKIFESGENSPEQRSLLRHLHRRQLLAAARQMVHRALDARRAGEIGNALRIMTAAGWTIALAARPRPPRPAGRRIPWSYAGLADDPWQS